MYLQVNGQMVIKMEEEDMNMLMVIIMMDFFKKAKDKVRGLIVGKMVKNMLGNGNLIKWKEMVKSYNLMEIQLDKVNLLMIS